MRVWLAALAPLTAFFVVANGNQVNVTIDDQTGDALSGLVPTYAPLGTWSQGATCTGCFAEPDPAQAYMGTWHDTTYYPDGPRAANVSFTGASL